MILDEEFTEKLQLFSKNNNVSLFITLLSIFNSLITRYISQEEFIIGHPNCRQIT